MAPTVTLSFHVLTSEQLRDVLRTWSKFQRTAGRLMPEVYRTWSVTAQCEGPYFKAEVPPMYVTAAHLFTQLAFGASDSAEWELDLLGLSG